MEEKISILCDSIKSEELYNLLSKVLTENKEVIQLQEAPKETMALDPLVLVAIITTTGPAITTLLVPIISGLFALSQKKMELKQQISNNKSVIKIKTKDGNEYEFPSTLSDEEIKSKIEIFENQSIKKIILIADK